MGEGGERASRVISQGPFFGGAGIFPFAARRCQTGLASPWQKSRADVGTVRRYMPGTVLYRRAVGAGVATDCWSCSFQLWCACSKKAGILPSTALIRL